MKIQEINITRSTEKSVWFKRTRHFDGKTVIEKELKSTCYHKWFDTWEEANVFILERLTGEIVKANKSVKFAEKELLEYKSRLLLTQ